jgi:hypothetical protein
MPASSPIDVLAEELGAIAGRIERDSKLRIDAAPSELARDRVRKANCVSFGWRG